MYKNGFSVKNFYEKGQIFFHKMKEKLKIHKVSQKYLGSRSKHPTLEAKNPVFCTFWVKNEP